MIWCSLQWCIEKKKKKEAAVGVLDWEVYRVRRMDVEYYSLWGSHKHI